MKLLLVLGMMCIVYGFPMLRNIKEYDGEIFTIMKAMKYTMQLKK